jgi:hypothetical protein
MLPPGSTCSELGGQDDDPSSWGEAMGGCQLERPGTPHMCQHRAGDLLSIVVPRHGSCGLPMRSCMLVDPVGSQSVC